MSSSDKMEQLATLQKKGLITLDHYLTMVAELDGDMQDSDLVMQDAEADAGEIAGGPPAAGHGDAQKENSDVNGADEDGADNDDDDSGGESDAAEEVTVQQPSALASKWVDFMNRNAPPAAKVAAERKPNLAKHENQGIRKRQAGAAFDDEQRNVGRGGSGHQNGVRKNDVKVETMRQRLKENPNETLVIRGGQLFCVCCARKIGSGKGPARDHCKRRVHVEAKAKMDKSDTNRAQIQGAIHDYKGVVKDLHGADAQINGLLNVPEETQVMRAELLETFLKAGIEPYKLDKVRPFFERIGISLTGIAHSHCSPNPNPHPKLVTGSRPLLNHAHSSTHRCATSAPAPRYASRPNATVYCYLPIVIVPPLFF